MNDETRSEPLTPEQFAAQMRRLYTLDPESGHIKADALMTELLTALGYGEGVKFFSEMDKWYA